MFGKLLEWFEDWWEQREIERLWGDRIYHEREPAPIAARKLRELLLAEEDDDE